MSRVLVVEDEQHLAEGLRFNLEAEGYQVQLVDAGEAALEKLKAEAPAFDVVMLDVMLPGKERFDVVSKMREAGQFVPTLILTARGHADDVLQRLRGRRRRLSDQALRAVYSDRSHPRAVAPPGLAAIGFADRAPRPCRCRPLSPSIASLSGTSPSISIGLELHVRDQVFPLTLMEANVLRYLIEQRGQACFAQGHASRMSGDCTRTPTRAPSTTSSCDCAAILKTIRRGRGICRPCAAWATGLSLRRGHEGSRSFDARS